MFEISPSTESNHAHLQCPHSADPDFKLALDAFDIVQLNTLPPASSSGFPPEEEQLLRHADGIAAHFVASNVAAQPSEGQTADDGLVRLTSSVAPLVVVVETTAKQLLANFSSSFGSNRKMGVARVGDNTTYPAVSISIK